MGAVLVPKLLDAGYEVRVIDLFIYGDDVLRSCEGRKGYSAMKADIRDRQEMERALEGMDAVIHLACISNDPSYELNPALGRSINYDAFLMMLELLAKKPVKRFVYASSSSVYGVKSDPEVTEELPLEPLTDYSKYKAFCEEELLRRAPEGMTTLIVRPATVCGWSPRLRLDLTVNILTHHAVRMGEISVFGGGQKRPNIHIDDMTDFYVQSLRWPHAQVHRRIYNVGYENHTVDQIAEMVRAEVGESVRIKRVPTDDNRSYHVSSEKVARELGFRPKRTIVDAIRDLKKAFADGRVPDSMDGSRYYNIKRMQEIDLR